MRIQRRAHLEGSASSLCSSLFELATCGCNADGLEINHETHAFAMDLQYSICEIVSWGVARNLPTAVNDLSILCLACFFQEICQVLPAAWWRRSQIGYWWCWSFGILPAWIYHCPRPQIFPLRCCSTDSRSLDVAYGAKDGATPTFAAPSSPSEAECVFSWFFHVFLFLPNGGCVWTSRQHWAGAHTCCTIFINRDTGQGCVYWYHSLHRHLKVTMQVKWLWAARCAHLLPTPTQSKHADIS